MTDNRGADARGRSSSKAMGHRNVDAERPERPYVALSLRMKESPAWRVLKDQSRRILDRLEVEHLRHGATENGNLPCTYRDFIGWGVSKEAFTTAVAQAQALGFIRVTIKGQRKYGVGPARATRYRLTYLPTREDGRSLPPTNDWQSFASIEDARAALAKVAKKPKVAQPGRPSRDVPVVSTVPANDRGAA